MVGIHERSIVRNEGSTTTFATGHNPLNGIHLLIGITDAGPILDKPKLEEQREESGSGRIRQMKDPSEF